MRTRRTSLGPALFFTATAAILATANAPVQHRVGVIAATGRDRPLLREWDANIDAMLRTGELVVRRVRTDPLVSSRTHERYDQYVNGVRVAGADVTRQLSERVSQSIFGQIHDVSGVQTQPTLEEEDIRAVLATLSDGGVASDRRLELVILPTDEGRYALTYATHIWTNRRWMKTFIDAHDGRVVLQYNDLQTQSAIGSGAGVLGDQKKVSARSASGRYLADDALRPPTLVTYDMQGNWSRTDAYLFESLQPTLNDIASDTDNNWTDAANVDAHVYVGWTYDYYFTRLGRRGLDDNNVPIYAVSHPARRSDFNTLPQDVRNDYLTNAFWCTDCGPTGRGAMVFGDGLPSNISIGGQSYNYFAGALDVVAHELTHGLTAYSSRLVYRNESGALNEAFSDMIGTAVEFRYQPSGSGPRQPDYLMAEDIITPGGVRSMSDPLAYGDPDHYSRRFTGTADNGGVHSNSGIANNAFYLAIEGGVNRTSGLRVTGVGAANREQIEKVFYRAFVFLLPSTATFSTARAATIQAARDLYGPNSAPERAVTEAWTAVGVN
jgi:bacillolysin